MPRDTFYAECDYCGPLQVYGDNNPETHDHADALDAAESHMERTGHIVKVWQLVATRLPEGLLAWTNRHSNPHNPLDYYARKD